MGRALTLGVFLLIVLVLMYVIVPWILSEVKKKRNGGDPPSLGS